MGYDLQGEKKDFWRGIAEFRTTCRISGYLTQIQRQLLPEPRGLAVSGGALGSMLTGFPLPEYPCDQGPGDIWPSRFKVWPVHGRLWSFTNLSMV